MFTLSIYGLKGQQALSPGHRPGCKGGEYIRPVRAKELQNNNAFALDAIYPGQYSGL